MSNLPASNSVPDSSAKPNPSAPTDNMYGHSSRPVPDPHTAADTVSEVFNPDDTIAYSSPTTSTSPTTPPSLARWWRQVAFVPMLHNRWLTPEGRQTLNQAVTQAEIGHQGEVVLVVENTLPLAIARTHSCRDRAVQVFADYQVWDTEDNTGVLVYLNVCEHRLEIVADRGISRHVLPVQWQALCDKALAGIRDGRQVESLCELLIEIGELLRQHYQLGDDPRGNELSDKMVYLR